MELIRTDQYGDIWFLRVRLSRTDYRMKNLKVTSLEEAQEMAFEAWQSMMRDIENKEAFKQSLTRLFHFFIENEQRQVDSGKLSQGTVSSKKSQIMNGILPYVAERKLRDPNRVNANKDFRDYPDWRLLQGKEPATVNNEIITIKEAFRWFRREDYIDYDPPFIEPCRVDQKKRDESNPPIKVDDYLLIKEWLDAYVKDSPKGREKYMRELFRAYVTTSVSAALRPHEWRALTWGMVKVGSTENEIGIPPWTKTGRRLVFFRGDSLKVWQKVQKGNTQIEITDDTPLGMDPSTGKSISYATYNARWDKMMEELKMNYTEYSCRAAGICSRLEAGVPIFTVARWAGNSVRVIEANYTASIMRSEKMKRQVMKDEGRKWQKGGILLGSNEDYVIRDLD